MLVSFMMKVSQMVLTMRSQVQKMERIQTTRVVKKRQSTQ